MNRYFTQKAGHAIGRCPEIAGKLGHTYIGSEHLLLSLAEEKDSVAAHFLEEKSAFADKLRQVLEDSTGTGTPTILSAKDMTPRARHIIESAGTFADEVGGRIGTERDGNAGDYETSINLVNTPTYIPVTFTWEPGKKYVYTLVYTASGTGGKDENNNDQLLPIEFSVDVVDFTEVTEPDINLGV